MNANPTFTFFATTPKGLELLLVDELKALGAVDAAEKLAGVVFSGDLSLAYKACLWSRLANRILLRLASFPAATPEALYEGVKMIPWDAHLDPEGTIAVNFVSSQSAITHTLFGAQKVKDAIVDQLREKYHTRPSVAKEHPDLSVNVYLHRDQATVSLDLSGDSLHRRNYRLGGGGAAPLKENLAAAILLRAGWNNIAKTGGSLVDPMCGSGTLLIEGALMAGDVAPGLLREYFGFLRWKQHDAQCWETLWDEAKARREKGLANLPTIVGYDKDPYAIKIAFENVERAGLLGKVHVEKREVANFAPVSTLSPGLVVVNPPYGERLGEVEELQPLYTLLGDRLKAGFVGWKAAVFTGNPDLGKVMGIRAKKFYALYNGALPCKLLLLDVSPESFIDRSPERENERRIAAAQNAIGHETSPAVQMFINRLTKKLKHRKRQAQKQGMDVLRVYDKDLPEYAFAIDLREGGAEVQEYEAPLTAPVEKVVRRRNEVLAVLPGVLNLPPASIYYRLIPRA